MQNNLSRDILALVKQLDHVSFAELEKKIAGVKGDFEIAFDKYNIVLWQNISREAVDAIHDLEAEKLIHLAPCAPLVYRIDGIYLTMPIATRAKQYKEPHWLPCTLKLGAA